MSATAEPGLQSGARAPSAGACGWLVSPWFDGLFIANLLWPLAVLVQFGDGFSGGPGLQFWQLYYVTTPHRWATLLLVFLDRGRFHQCRTTFLLVAACVIAICLGVWVGTGALTCLLAVDYVWNAWHFASQHHGIHRIYGRLTEPPGQNAASMAQKGPAALALEKWIMRGFLLYVILRVASATWPEANHHALLRAADWIVLAAPLGLVARVLARPGVARRTYMISVCALYASLLWSVHERRLGLVLALATASALFHAIEYLALVSWSVRQRHAAMGEQMGILGWLAPRWGITLAVFVLILGAGGWLLDQNLLEFWLLVNVMVAFLHYAYDGLIWRRRPAA